MADTIDIEYFPTNETAKHMLSRVSPIYGYSRVGKWLFQVMGMEMDEARKVIESLRDQCYLDRVTWGIRYWEERYGIPVDESLDLETRRARIRRAGSRFGPINPARIEEVLEDLTGRIVHVVEDNPHYCFDLQFEAGRKDLDYQAIIEKINAIKPSHLSYRIVLPRTAELRLYFGLAFVIKKKIRFTQFIQSGLGDPNWLTDDDDNILLADDGSVLLAD